jgi:hypothetical protein
MYRDPLGNWFPKRGRRRLPTAKEWRNALWIILGIVVLFGLCSAPGLNERRETPPPGERAEEPHTVAALPPLPAERPEPPEQRTFAVGTVPLAPGVVLRNLRCTIDLNLHTDVQYDGWRKDGRRTPVSADSAYLVSTPLQNSALGLDQCTQGPGAVALSFGTDTYYREVGAKPNTDGRVPCKLAKFRTLYSTDPKLASCVFQTLLNTKVWYEGSCEAIFLFGELAKAEEEAAAGMGQLAVMPIPPALEVPDQDPPHPADLR